MNKEKWITEILIKFDKEIQKLMGDTEADIRHLVAFNQEKWVPPTHCLISLINQMNMRKAQREMIEKISRALTDMKSNL